MDRTDQFASFTLAGENTNITRVDYEVCNQCGFRLMRVETTMIGDQHLVVTHCPICELRDYDNRGHTEVSVLAEEKYQYFDRWLSVHDLDRDTLEYRYHLRAEHFFDQNK